VIGSPAGTATLTLRVPLLRLTKRCAPGRQPLKFPTAETAPGWTSSGSTNWIVASIVSLGAVGLVIVDAGQSGSASSLAQVFLSVLSVIASWTVIHTLFTLRYARLYFLDGTEGGIDFGSDDRPRYSDFAYVAFTLGMTYQVSDTTLRSARLRATALRHVLLSYLFGAVIIAVTINLVAGLMR